MGLNIEIADYIGIAISAAVFLISSGVALYPHILGHDEVYKLGIWGAVVSFVNIIMHSAFLKDIGYALRWDGQEFNYLRWIVITLTMVFSHCIATSHGWHDFIEGHWSIAGILLSSICFLFTGLSTYERRAYWFVFGLVAYAVSAIFLLVKADYDIGRGKLKRAMLFVYLLATSIFYILNIIVLFFAPEFLNIIQDINTRDWVYWAGTNGLVLAPLLAYLFYAPVPESKVNHAYAQVPTSQNAASNMAAVDSSMLQNGNKSFKSH